MTAVSEAVLSLETAGHYGPFACVLGQRLFGLAQGLRLSRAIPGERIEGFLGGGPLLRSSLIRGWRGAVIALGDAPVDLVVGSDLSVQFIQQNEEPRYVCLVSESIRLRIKDRTGLLPWRLIKLGSP